MRNPDSLSIWRDNPGLYQFQWQPEQHDKALEIVLQADHRDVATVQHDGAGVATVAGLPAGQRQLFQLQNAAGEQVVWGERRIYMEGTPNLRDIGGYRSDSGQRVRWGKLFRSGRLSGLSDDDMARFAHLSIDVICDFRRDEEQQFDPSLLPVSPAPTLLKLPISPGSQSGMMNEAWEHPADAQAMVDFMRHVNHDLAAEQTASFRRMFEVLLDTPDGSMLVHCSAGKDRTGFAVALLLLALGVPESTVMQDYMLTGRYFIPDIEIESLRSRYGLESVQGETLRPMMEVRADYLDAALVYIRSKHPSYEDYIATELGVGPVALAELRSRYLV